MDGFFLKLAFSVCALTIARNREIYEALHAIGWKRYAISSVPFDQQDWRDHFGRLWWPLAVSKYRFDPRNILTPGQGIF